MATSHLLLYMIWAPPRHTDLLKKKAIWIGTGRKQSQNCPRSVETGFPWRPHKSSKRHVMTDGVVLRSRLNPKRTASLHNPCFYKTVPGALGILKKTADHWL